MFARSPSKTDRSIPRSATLSCRACARGVSGASGGRAGERETRLDMIVSGTRKEARNYKAVAAKMHHPIVLEKFDEREIDIIRDLPRLIEERGMSSVLLISLPVFAEQ
eukprot:scaffold289_cov147-Amphora_coffeaeformis.AAC.8